MLSTGVGQGKVKENQGQFPRRSLPHPDIVGFDIAMRHPFLLQPVRHVQQFFPQALQQIKRQATFVPDALCQRIRTGFGFYARHSHKQRGMTAHDGLFIEFDNIGMAELSRS